jgi:hypothetical protein
MPAAKNPAFYTGENLLGISGGVALFVDAGIIDDVNRQELEDLSKGRDLLTAEYAHKMI